MAIRPIQTFMWHTLAWRILMMEFGLAIVVCMTTSAAYSQTQQFLPEAEVYRNVNPNLRWGIDVSRTREGGAPTETDVGPDLDISIKPLLKLKRFTVFRLDPSASRLLTLGIGYRYVMPASSPNENRFIMEITPRFPLMHGIVIAVRNRGELRLIAGNLSWRVRERLTLQRTFTVSSYHFTPYSRTEVYYDSKSAKWSRTVLKVGCTFPIRKRIEIEPGFEHQNDTSQKPNHQVNAASLILSLYF